MIRFEFDFEASERSRMRGDNEVLPEEADSLFFGYVTLCIDSSEIGGHQSPLLFVDGISFALDQLIFLGSLRETYVPNDEMMPFVGFERRNRDLRITSSGYSKELFSSPVVAAECDILEFCLAVGEFRRDCVMESARRYPKVLTLREFTRDRRYFGIFRDQEEFNIPGIRTIR